MNFTDFAIDKTLYKNFVSATSSEYDLITGGGGTQLSTDETIVFSFVPKINGSLYVFAQFSNEQVLNVLNVIVYCGDEKQTTFSNAVKDSSVRGYFTIKAFSKYTVAVQASKDTGTLPTVSGIYIRGAIADNYGKYITKV